MKKIKKLQPEAEKIRKNYRKKKVGKVVSKKIPKLAIVEIERLRQHPYYLKRYKVHRRIAAHDEKDASKIGNIVEIEECRPISKTKRWKIVEILSPKASPSSMKK
jgi:small subunit ribosomal protein S17